MNRLHKLWNSHPNLLSWAALALGMVVIVIIAARKVGFLPGQWAALIMATIALAGLCVWIISWEDRDDETRQAAARGERLTSGDENQQPATSNE